MISFEPLRELYPEDVYEQNLARYKRLIDSFPIHQHSELRFFVASGRTEIIGNHTDHQGGHVVAASVHLDTVTAARKIPESKIIVQSAGWDPIEIDFNSLKKRKSEEGTSASIVRGIANYLTMEGANHDGIEIHIDSTVLPGSGLSSSAAFEVAIAKTISAMNMNDLASNYQLALYSKAVENDYFGKPSGLMDQAASALGGVVGLNFSELPHLRIVNIDFDFEDFDYTLAVVNTGGSHADLTALYSSIPQEMKKVAKLLGFEDLSEANKDDLLLNVNMIRKKAGDRALLRALHFFDEDTLADELIHQYEHHDVRGDELFGEFAYAMNMSEMHNFTMLQNVADPATPKEQPLQVALQMCSEFSDSFDEMPTIQRVHGGGFAGTILVACPSERFDNFTEYMNDIFGAGAVTKLHIRKIGCTEILLQG